MNIQLNFEACTYIKYVHVYYSSWLSIALIYLILLQPSTILASAHNMLSPPDISIQLEPVSEEGEPNESFTNPEEKRFLQNQYTFSPSIAANNMSQPKRDTDNLLNIKP